MELLTLLLLELGERRQQRQHDVQRLLDGCPLHQVVHALRDVERQVPLPHT
jgi:hypothetical protein